MNPSLNSFLDPLDAALTTVSLAVSLHPLTSPPPRLDSWLASKTMEKFGFLKADSGDDKDLYWHPTDPFFTCQRCKELFPHTKDVCLWPPLVPLRWSTDRYRRRKCWQCAQAGVLCSCTVKGLDFSLWLRPGRNASLMNAHGEEIKREVVEEAHRNRLAVRRLDGGDWDDGVHWDEAPSTASTARGLFLDGARTAPLSSQHSLAMGERSRGSQHHDLEHTVPQMGNRGGAPGSITFNTFHGQSPFSPRMSPPVPLSAPVPRHPRRLSPDSPPLRDTAPANAIRPPLASASSHDLDVASRLLPPIRDARSARPPGTQASTSPPAQTELTSVVLETSQEEPWPERTVFIRDAQALSGVPLTGSYLLAMAAPTPSVEREVARHLNNAEMLLREARRELELADQCLAESTGKSPSIEDDGQAGEGSPDSSVSPASARDCAT